MRLQRLDLALFESVLPEFADLEGALEASLDLRGTLGQPDLSGQARLSDGRAQIPEAGIRLKDITLDVSIASLLDAPSRSVEIRGSASSGDGSLALEGTMAWTGDTETLTGSGRLYGENFRAMDTDLAKITVTPDLTMRIDGRKITVEGNVDLPKASVTIRELPPSAVDVSADQRIAGLEPAVRNPAVEVIADIGLRFGDEVHFTGFGLDAGLEGTLRLRQRDSRTTANGSIYTRGGFYEAYEQRLSINRGRLFWSDTPLVSPAVALDASRTPRPEVTVGLRASGSLERPTVALYSTPAMPESEQLAYLLFGRPLQSASTGETSMMNEAAYALGIRAGNFLTERFGGRLGFDQLGIEVPAGAGNASAALVLGKYLTPDLYVSYGLSLLESLSTLRIEYALSRRLRVVTESSAERNSADLYYAVERR